MPKSRKNLIIFLEKLQHQSRLRLLILVTIIIITILFLLIYRDKQSLSPAVSQIINNKVLENSGERTIKYNVFGDHFANDLSIDSSQTTFYYDRVTTAYSFFPLYTWQNSDACSNKNCGFTSKDWSFPEFNEEYCLKIGCLKVENKDIIYQNKKIILPSELKGKEIINISLYPLKNDWLVGVVFKTGEKEQGVAYRFNGKTFVNLDANKSFLFISRKGYSGARFGFGGDDNNFIVLFGGYDLVAYQIIKDKIIDLQSFLGLRVADGGFAPVIIKQKRDQETLWYICSRSEGKPKLIKLWQNGSESVKGALSLTDILLGETNLATSVRCRAGDKAGELELAFEDNGQTKLNIFKDNGFKQDLDYVLTSKNIFLDKGEINSANFGGLLACDKQECGAGIVKNSLQFLVSFDGQKFTVANLNRDLIFPPQSRGLYWQIKTVHKNIGVDYSPWIDGVTAISYFWR